MSSNESKNESKSEGKGDDDMLGGWENIDFDTDIEMGDKIGGGGIGVIYKGYHYYHYNHCYHYNHHYH